MAQLVEARLSSIGSRSADSFMYQRPSTVCSLQSKRSRNPELHDTLQAPAPVMPANASVSNTNHMAKVSTNGTGNYTLPIKKKGRKEGKREAKLASNNNKKSPRSSLFFSYYFFFL